MFGFIRIIIFYWDGNTINIQQSKSILLKINWTFIIELRFHCLAIFVRIACMRVVIIFLQLCQFRMAQNEGNLSADEIQSKSHIIFPLPNHSKHSPEAKQHQIHPTKIYQILSMMLVSTENVVERVRLEEEFETRNGYFQVPQCQIETLEAIIRSVSFEYYQNSASVLGQKILAFAQLSVRNICSLTLLREIFGLLSREEHCLIQHQQHLLEMNRIFEGDENQGYSQSEDFSAAEYNDYLFDLAEKGNLKVVSSLDLNDLQEHFEVPLHQRERCPMGASDRTQLPSIHHINPQEKEDRSPNQKLDRSNNQQNFFYSAQSYYGQDWWKQQKHPNDSSQQMSRFDVKGSNLINQKSIGRLVIDEIKYDLNREIQLGRDIKKHQELEGFKYKRMMKQKLMSAKLKKKKRK